MKNGRKYGVGLIELMLIALTVLFLLKIFGAGIPWIWVLSPVWIPIVALLVWITAWILISSFKEWEEKRKRRKWH